MTIEYSQNSDTEQGFFTFGVKACLPVHMGEKTLVPVPLAPDTFTLNCKNITGSIGFILANHDLVAGNIMSVWIFETIVDSANAVLFNQPIPTLVLPIAVAPNTETLRGPYPIFTETVTIIFQMLLNAGTGEIYLNRWA